MSVFIESTPSTRRMQSRLSRRSGRKTAFTLIELLVVIAIVAILATILFPVFARAREKGRQSACLSNMRQIAMAQLLYAQDFDETITPLGTGSGDAPCSTYDGSRKRWPLLLLPYTRDARVHTCPSVDSDQILPLVPPSVKSPTSCNDGHYAINNAYARTVYGTPPPNQPLAAAIIPADTVLLVEGGGFHSFDLGDPRTDALVVLSQRNPPLLGGHDALSRLTDSNTYPNARYGLNARHNGGANLAFCDGHARWMKLDQIAKKNSRGVLYIFTLEDDASR